MSIYIYLYIPFYLNAHILVVQESDNRTRIKLLGNTHFGCTSSNIMKDFFKSLEWRCGQDVSQFSELYSTVYVLPIFADIFAPFQLN